MQDKKKIFLGIVFVLSICLLYSLIFYAQISRQVKVNEEILNNSIKADGLNGSNKKIEKINNLEYKVLTPFKIGDIVEDTYTKERMKIIQIRITTTINNDNTESVEIDLRGLNIKNNNLEYNDSKHSILIKE